MLAVKKIVKSTQSNFDNNARQFSYRTGEGRLNKLFSKLSNFVLEMREAVKNVKNPTVQFLGPASTHQNVIVFSFSRKSSIGIRKQIHKINEGGRF